MKGPAHGGRVGGRKGGGRGRREEGGGVRLEQRGAARPCVWTGSWLAFKGRKAQGNEQRGKATTGLPRLSVGQGQQQLRRAGTHWLSAALLCPALAG